jgi:hypothetical protein
MTPSDTTIDYKVRSFLHLHSDFGYNSLSSTCICHYLNVGTNMSQSASPSKLNFRFVGSPAVLHCEGHNSSIRSAIEVNEHLTESLFDKLSNRSSPISISHCQGLKIVKILCHYFCQELHCRHGLLAILGTLAQVGAHPKEMENSPRKPLDILLFGHHLRRLARMSKPSRRPSPIRVRVCFILLDQSALERTPRTHPDSVFDDPHMDGNIIS